jgi:hypothetical protein
MSDHPWDPHDLTFEEQEWAAQHHFGESKVRLNGDRFVESIEQVSGERFKVIPAPPELYDKDVIMNRFVAAVNIASNNAVGNSMCGYGDEELFGVSEEAREVMVLSSEDKRSVITKEVLARHWGIGLYLVHGTLRMTTLRGVRPFLNPTD